MSDLVDRQAAIDALNKRARDNFTLADGYQWYLGALHDVADDIRQLPSVQPRKGKWHGKGDSEGFGIFICDNCGKFAMMEYDFCPNCGCRMEEGDSDE